MAKINVTVEVPDDDCLTETSNSKYTCPFVGTVYVETFTCKIFNKKITRYGGNGRFHADPCKECLDARVKENPIICSCGLRVYKGLYEKGKYICDCGKETKSGPNKSSQRTKTIYHQL